MLLLLFACSVEKPLPTTVDRDEPPVAADADADGFTTEDDCDDADATVFPGATETIGDDVDADCDGDPDLGVARTVSIDVQTSGIALAANDDAVFLDIQFDFLTEGEQDYFTGQWIGVLDPESDVFWRYHWTAMAFADPLPTWTARPDLHADDTRLFWANAYVDGAERNLLAMVMPFSTERADGTRILSGNDQAFEDVDLLDQGDGTFTVAGCDPAVGELVLMHGTPAEYINVDVPYDYETAWAAESCSVAALRGALIVSDPAEEVFDLYSYDEDDGLQYVLGWPGYRGYDLDTLVIEGSQWTADAEGPAGLRLVTPDGEVWWEGADVRQVDLAATAAGDVVVAVLDADGAPWLVWGGGATGVSLAATFPHADDIGVAVTPDGEVLVAVDEADTVSWARWRLGE